MMTLDDLINHLMLLRLKYQEAELHPIVMVEGLGAVCDAHLRIDHTGTHVFLKVTEVR